MQNFGIFGFRKSHSTTHALLNMVECLDNGQFAIGIFVDLKKAFDTVNHQHSVQKNSITMAFVEMQSLVPTAHLSASNINRRT